MSTNTPSPVATITSSPSPEASPDAPAPGTTVKISRDGLELSGFPTCDKQNGSGWDEVIADAEKRISDAQRQISDLFLGIKEFKRRRDAGDRFPISAPKVERLTQK